MTCLLELHGIARTGQEDSFHGVARKHEQLLGRCTDLHVTARKLPDIHGSFSFVALSGIRPFPSGLLAGQAGQAGLASLAKPAGRAGPAGLAGLAGPAGPAQLGRPSWAGRPGPARPSQATVCLNVGPNGEPGLPGQAGQGGRHGYDKNKKSKMSKCQKWPPQSAIFGT